MRLLVQNVASLTLLVIVALVAACSSGGEDSVAVVERDAGEFGRADAPNDSSFPPGVAPDTPVGTYGFSRYVWTLTGAGVTPTLVEGPRGQQVRCQDEELACSFQDLKQLYEVQAPIPQHLGMTRAELGMLVRQLDALQAKLSTYTHPDHLCEDGYVRSSSQIPNMGIHMLNAEHSQDGFVVDKPEILLLAKAGGETLRQSELGQCVDGKWTGDPNMVVTGAAYTVPITDDHPEGFAGPIDNWHVHYNTCTGADKEVLETLFDPALCKAEGGVITEKIPLWMVHAYAAPGFDSQQGVFAMFNGSVWPLASKDDIFAVHTQSAAAGDDLVMSPINNFSFGAVEVQAGNGVVFTNSDGVPHSVTSGLPGNPTGEFDSGAFGTGQTFTATFDQAGEYLIYCTLHPAMTGAVTVTPD
jgi:plastocyanin